VRPLGSTKPANEATPAPPKPHAIRNLPEIQIEVVGADEWWTTETVCAFLKLGRMAIWERRRNPAFAFPKPANLGGGRNHYRASAIRLCAERMALASIQNE
jgi:predicted DNA-binding transcriptional regulator AlpA